MTDARRSDRHSNPDHPDRDRDARIEELLLAGLDHYFAGRHDLAINIWTRVLFLDRSHGKARAYIERAQGCARGETAPGGRADPDRSPMRSIAATAALRGAADVGGAGRRRRRGAEPAASTRSARSGGAAMVRRRPARSHRSASIVTNRPESAAREARLAWVFAGIATGVLLAAVARRLSLAGGDPFELTVAAAALRLLVSASRCRCLAGSEIRLARARPLCAAKASCTRRWRCSRRASSMRCTAASVRRAPCHHSATAASRPGASGPGFPGQRARAVAGTPATARGGAK